MSIGDGHGNVSQCIIAFRVVLLRSTVRGGPSDGSPDVRGLPVQWAASQHQGHRLASLVRCLPAPSHRSVNPFFPTVPTCAVRETASLGIVGEPRVPPLNSSVTIVL